MTSLHLGGGVWLTTTSESWVLRQRRGAHHWDVVGSFRSPAEALDAARERRMPDEVLCQLASLVSAMDLDETARAIPPDGGDA